MKKLCLVFLSLTCSLVSFGQEEKEKEKDKPDSKYPKEVKLNWKTKTFEGPLPIDESFKMIVYSDDSLPEELVLIRYISRNTFYYFNQNITLLESESNVPLNKIIMYSEKTTVKGDEKTVETSTQRDGDPKKVMKRAQTYLVSPLRANFYYSVLDSKVYNNAKDNKDVSDVVENGVVANTYLSYLDNNNRKVTAIIGVSYILAQTQEVRPYLGLRYHFVPINKALQSRYYEEMHYDGDEINKFFNRLSLDVGVSIASIQDSLQNQYDLFGKTNLYTGLGFRLGDGLFLSSGAMWYTKRDISDVLQPKDRIRPAFYLSLSFDWDFSKSLDSFKKVLVAP